MMKIKLIYGQLENRKTPQTVVKRRQTPQTT